MEGQQKINKNEKGAKLWNKNSCIIGWIQEMADMTQRFLTYMPHAHEKNPH